MQGFRSFVWTAVSYQLKDNLKLSASVSQFVFSIAFFPWSIKPLYGYGTLDFLFLFFIEYSHTEILHAYRHWYFYILVDLQINQLQQEYFHGDSFLCLCFLVRKCSRTKMAMILSSFVSVFLLHLPRILWHRMIEYSIKWEKKRAKNVLENARS